MGNVFMNQLAVFTTFANFVLNSSIAFVIWWRVLRSKQGYESVQESIPVDSQYRSHDGDMVFKLVGLLFSVMAVNSLLVALLRADDLDGMLFTIFRNICSVIFFYVSLYAMFVVLPKRLRFAVPTILGCTSLLFSGIYVWASV